MQTTKREVKGSYSLFLLILLKQINPKSCFLKKFVVTSYDEPQRKKHNKNPNKTAMTVALEPQEQEALHFLPRTTEYTPPSEKHSS